MVGQGGRCEGESYFRNVRLYESSLQTLVVTQDVDHAYDAFNQWVTRTVDPDGEQGSAAIEQTVFVHDGGQIVLHRYLWGPAVDQLLADEAVESLASPGEVLWPLGDHLGSVRDVVSRDASGNIHRRKHTEYDSFGNVTDEQHYDSAGTAVADTHAEAIEQLFGYTGRPLDESTGLQNNLHRWYDSAVGRWASDDPIGFAAGDANLGRYVGNAATAFTDADGLETRAYDLMREFGSNRGMGSGFGRQISQDLTTVGELSLELNPVTGPLLSGERVLLGHDRLRNCPVDDNQRAAEAALALGGSALGAAIAKFRLFGRTFGSADDAADAVADLRRRSLVEQIALDPDVQRSLLRQALGLPVGSGRVAHHIIPLEAIPEFLDLMQRAARGGFDINSCNNGFALLAKYHGDGHPQYNQWAFDALQGIIDSKKYAQMADADIAGEVQRLADNARRWLSRRRSELP